MGESGSCVFPMEDALEMILMFGSTGRITYANAAARSKLITAATYSGKNQEKVNG